MYRAISTRYFGPTNHRGSRIIVTDGDNRTSVSIDDRWKDPHKEALLIHCHKMNWQGYLIGGGQKQGNVYVFLPPDCQLAMRNRGPSEDVIHIENPLPESPMEAMASTDTENA